MSKYPTADTVLKIEEHIPEGFLPCVVKHLYLGGMEVRFGFHGSTPYASHSIYVQDSQDVSALASDILEDLLGNHYIDDEHLTSGNKIGRI